MLRLFVAVTLDARALRACGDECRRVEEALGRIASAVRFPRPEGLHFTLKFLGWVPEDGVEALREGVRRAARGCRPFEVALAGFEAFPSPRRPRVVYLGVERGGPELTSLAARVEAEVAPLGYPTEARGFTPHVTLLRVKDPKKAAKVGEAVAQLRAREPIRFEVGSVVLMRSELNPGGSVYTPVETVPLQAGGNPA